MKKTIRLTESDLTRIVKRIIKEIDFKQLGKGAAITSLVGALGYALYVHPNKIYITTQDGEERTAEKGDTFVGVVKSIRPTGVSKRITGNKVKIKTSNGDIVEFYTEEDIEFNVGDTIKVVAGSTFRMFNKGTDYENL